MKKIDDMDQDERQTAERLRSTSEYIKAAESFSKYAHKEWIEDYSDERAMLMCCIDHTVPDGTGMMGVAAGNKDLITAAVMAMMQDDDLGEVFHKARVVSETTGDMDENVRSTRIRLRTFYILAVVVSLWTLFVVGLKVWGISDWITTISNLLLIAFIGLQLNHEIINRRRMLKRLLIAQHNDHEERLERKLQSMFDKMMKRMEDDDEDDDEY